MSVTVNLDDLCAIDLSLICRGCLATSGEMKNMVEWGLLDDFYRLTNVQVNTSDNPSLLLCVKCEDVIDKCRSFKATCQQADKLLRSAIEKKLLYEQSNFSNNSNSEDTSVPQDNLIHSELSDNKLIINIIAPHMDSKIYLPCIYCGSNFLKRTDLSNHMVKYHKTSENFNVLLKYYCHIGNCSHNISLGKEKHFTGRKHLNQHIFKVHKEKITCDICHLAFFNEGDFKRHLKMCNFVHTCQACDKPFKTYEVFLVHLLRKHPELHKQYMRERKAVKRSIVAQNHVRKFETDKNEVNSIGNDKNIRESNVDPKKIKMDKCKSDSDKSDFFCDSPKRSFATQTLDLEKHIKNDVTLPSWHPEKSDDPKKDEMSTQTVFEDLLSLKSNMSEDDAMFSDSVSLSDIQTQTLPLEFGLSRSNKETITSETQSPDLSIKETQTCICLYDTLKPNFRCTESPSNFNMLTSTETQTLDFRGSFYNDLSSFSSAETQTCFDDDGIKEL